MRPRRRLTKERIGTKDRFVSVLWHRNLYPDIPEKPWYRQRALFLPLLMIFVIFVLLLAIKGIYLAQDRFSTSVGEIQPSTPDSSSSQEMDYEEAKEIFGG